MPSVTRLTADDVGSDPRVDEARAKHEDILAFLQHGVGDRYSPEEGLDRLLALGAPPGHGTPPPAPDPSSPAAPAPGPPAAGLTGTFNPLPPGTEVVPG